MKGTRLGVLWIRRTAVKDISSLQGMPLTTLEIDFKGTAAELAILRSTSVETINGKPRNKVIPP